MELLAFPRRIGRCKDGRARRFVPVEKSINSCHTKIITPRPPTVPRRLTAAAVLRSIITTRP